MQNFWAYFLIYLYKKHYEYINICPKVLTIYEYYDRGAKHNRITIKCPNAQSPISLHFLPYPSYNNNLISSYLDFGVIKKPNIVIDMHIINQNMNISSLVLLVI